VSEKGEGTPPFRVIYSGRCREEVKRLLARAAAKGRFAEVAQILQNIHSHLRWIPLDFGESLRDYGSLGITEHLGSIGPLAVKYGVDESRRIVYVVVPFKLLPNSGL
jgi:hypothetical protein